ncbi:MAG TPA: hypothetical protein VGK84_10780 [Candidatus Tumulicola sp.]|jgi:hypothetical protein
MPARLRAALAYLALSVPFGIAVHIGSEFAGLGRDADELSFSPLHAYLAVLAIVSIVGFCRWSGVLTGGPGPRRRVAQMADALPFRGRGPKFFAFSAALQFGFFLITQLGEGCPLCHGDAAVGVMAALVASLVGALALIALRKEIVRAIVLGGSARDRRPPELATRRATAVTFQPVSTYSTFAAVLGNRPPPVFS